MAIFALPGSPSVGPDLSLPSAPAPFTRKASEWLEYAGGLVGEHGDLDPTSACPPARPTDAGRNRKGEGVPPGDTAADPEGTGRCQPATGTAEAGHEGSEAEGTGM